MVTVTLNPAIDCSLSIPGFRPNTVNRVQAEHRSAGGKGINVATFLSSYGVPTAATGFLGRDNAALFESHFTHHAIRDRFIRVAGETRMNLKILNPTDNETTDINNHGFTPHPEDLHQLETLIDTLALHHDWFVLSGSLPQGVPPSTYHDLIARLRHRRRAVLLDTSGQPLRQALQQPPLPTIIKPNLMELQEALSTTFHGESALLSALHHLVSQGIEAVIVSRGADGALFVDKSNAIAARYPRQITVHTTVGAGDALVAGYLAARTNQLDAENTARVAIAFSTAVVQGMGSTILPNPSALNALAADVTVRTLQWGRI